MNADRTGAIPEGRSGDDPNDTAPKETSHHMLIGLILLVASVGSWFPPGVALGAGLIALGLLLEFTSSGYS